MSNVFIDDDKVKAINEIYHDLEAEYYVKRHPEIYLQEQERWRHIGETFVKTDRERTVLDIGTGTGFVPLLLSKYLKENDKVICTDVSKKMLEITEEKMASFPRIRKQFIKADALEVSNLGLKADIITMNSVLHHIPDYEEVLPRLAGLLNPGGIFIIMHERNKLYMTKKPFLRVIYQYLGKTKHVLMEAVKNALSLMGLYKKKPKALDEFNQKVYGAVNARKFYDKPLTPDDINAIVDIHDPDERGEGFDPYAIQKKFFPGFKIVAMDTYKHLGPSVDDQNNGIKKLISGMVKRVAPDTGALFWLIMKK